MIYCTYVKKSIEFIRDIFDRIHHVKNPTEFLTPIFAEISHVKYPTEYIKREEFDRNVTDVNN